LPADNNAAISLQRQRERSVVDPVAEAEGLIDTAVRVQPANAIVGEPVEAGEAASHDDPAIGLKNSRGNLAIRARAGIEAGVQRAIKIEACDPITRDAVGESEKAGSNHFSVGLRNEDIYGVVRPRGWDESRVELTGRGSCGVDCANGPG